MARRIDSSRILVTAALFVFAGVAAHGQSAYDCFYVKAAHVARVRGEVLDQAGKPVAGAKVELMKQGGQDAMANTVSGQDGKFLFSAPTGPYWVHIEANGFHPAGLNVDVANKWYSFFNWKRLYIVMTAVAGAQPCPPEIGSRKELDTYVRDHAAAK